MSALSILRVATGAALLAFVAWRFGAAWLLKKLGGHALTLLAATVVIFLLLQVVPGDPASYMMGLNASPESIAALRQQMGLEGSGLERYFAWLGDLLSGRFGTSYTYQVPVGGLIAEQYLG